MKTFHSNSLTIDIDEPYQIKDMSVKDLLACATLKTPINEIANSMTKQVE
jgi:hypothetical protein